MPAEKSPAYQRYSKDYLGDENVVVMTLEEEGAYNRLMDFCWLEGSIPADMRDLAAMCKNVSAKKMQAMWKRIGRCFDPHPAEADRLIHPRLEEERAKQEEWRGQQSTAGKIGAAKRWGRHGSANGVATNSPMAENSSPSPTPSSSPSALSVITGGDVDSQDVENFVSNVIRVANGGMSAAGIEYEPILTSHSSRQAVFDWLAAGVPRDTIVESVFANATRAGKQISSMKYFTRAVTSADEKKKVVIPEGSQAAEVAKEGIAGNYHQSDAPRTGEVTTPAGDVLLEKERAEQLRVDAWKRDHQPEAEKLWNECRQEAIDKNLAEMGQRIANGYIESRFRRRIVDEILTPKAVA